jgi:hypothetical protein
MKTEQKKTFLHRLASEGPAAPNSTLIFIIMMMKSSPRQAPTHHH